VKPYIPYDVVPSDYILPMATSADGTALPARTLTVPAWVVDADIPMLPVVIPAEVRAAIAEGVNSNARGRNKGGASCQTVDEATELITQVRWPCMVACLLCTSSRWNSLAYSCNTGALCMYWYDQVLRQDIRGVHQGRGTVISTEGASSAVDRSSSAYMCALGNMEVAFTTRAGEITVQSVAFKNK
jgi:hypothetical protein